MYYVIFWDWKEDPNFKEINKALSLLDGKGKITELKNSGSDCSVVIVHSNEVNLNQNQAMKIWQACNEEDDIPPNIILITK